MDKCKYKDVINCNNDWDCFWGKKKKYGFTTNKCYTKTKNKNGVDKLRNSYINHLKNNLLVQANMALENAKTFNNKEKIMNSEEVIRQIEEQINSPLKIIYPDLYIDVNNLSSIENREPVKKDKDINISEQLLLHGHSDYDKNLYIDLYEKTPAFKKHVSRAVKISEIREKIKDLENKKKNISTSSRSTSSRSTSSRSTSSRSTSSRISPYLKDLKKRLKILESEHSKYEKSEMPILKVIMSRRRWDRDSDDEPIEWWKYYVKKNLYEKSEYDIDDQRDRMASDEGRGSLMKKKKKKKKKKEDKKTEKKVYKKKNNKLSKRK